MHEPRVQVNVRIAPEVKAALERAAPARERQPAGSIARGGGRD